MIENVDGKQPFIVEIYECYKKRVVVFAKDMEQAVNAAGDLRDSGVIDLSRNCFADISIDVLGIATDAGKEFYDQYVAD